ncbi:DivIVA domain-containing protein [Lactobacillus sp. ESL0233]|uniref:DivIVA domain-containing protein n=1 Tax=Lactobacillus sp. ESL0233 TaxID=2069354 RepID=UPI000EFC38E5|nr:DivIVA domain-containing protein [Lactobacillus sp. ESL0233]RMC41436.1 DivIVA domain-containing protein [Lactobacillus sp. ESL0233]
MADLNDIQLSTQDILKKQFRTKVKGIDPDEVDAFLDIVIADYDTFEQLIEDLYGQIGKLQGQLMADQQKEKQKDQFSKETNQTKATDEAVRTYTPKHSRNPSFTSISDSETNQTESSTNMAIIQRISALERKVYNLERQVYGLQKQ